MQLSTLEQHVMLAIVALHPNGYGVSIVEHLEKQTGDEPSVGSVYAALERLERKGYVKSRQGETTPERGGKRKLHFVVTAPGQHALRQSLQSISSLTRAAGWKERYA
jgi:PadR family transcriptional regulator, regulatory protein PadR